MLGTYEGKPIGDVGLLIQGGDGRFAMTGREALRLSRKQRRDDSYGWTQLGR
jgi:hypothetical protein